MDAETLLNEWESGESTGVRPARVQRLRDDLQRITGEPVPYRVSEIEAYMEVKKGHLTQLLRQAVEEDAEEEDD